ncbi:MAG TPA: cyclase family protein [Candidatus Limnocylindria bacterium]|nr:cyclase family protein [Candidatus Limnocylindria bacterium]
MPPRPLPTQEEVLGWIRGERRNWGRWGKDDQRGTINLITPARRAAAARLVTSGRSVSLSRPFPTSPGLNNALPAQHYMKTMRRGTGGFAADYYGIFYHGVASTHLDALCHTWDDEQAMWNGRDPKKEITFDGATFGSVEHWAEGIVTRGVMLDVPRHRGTPCVTQEEPVHGWELDDILRARNLTLEPGDAVCVYAGRERWQAQNPNRAYSVPFGPGPLDRPGLHISCLPFLRDHDVSLLVWDMLDALPIGYDVPWAVHACLFAYGLPLLDNALLEPLAEACAEEARDDFMLVIAPLRVIGGTGSPANPLAIF